MKAENNPVIDQFIIEIALIDPVSKIINKLNKGEFRDCDIKWLDNRLEVYMKFAAETLGIKNLLAPSMLNKEPFPFMNDYAYNYYLKYFAGLLEYFKSF